MDRQNGNARDDVIDVEPVRVETRQDGVPDAAEERRRNYMYVIYGLYTAAVFTGGMAALIGVIIAYVKGDDMAGTFYADHIRFLIRTFWGTLLGFAVGGVLAVILIGIPILWLASLWYLFRVVVGIVRLFDNRPVTPDGWLM